MIMSIEEGATLDERVLEWTEGTFMKLEAYKLKGLNPIQKLGGYFRLTDKGDKTILRSTLFYSMSNSFYAMMNNLKGKSDFTKVWASILAGYKKHIETGEEVTAKTKLDTESVVLIQLK